MFNKIGLREPVGTSTHSKHVYLETGNHYELLEDETSLIVAVDHESVGLVIYYRLTATDWNELVDGECGTVSETVSDHSIYATE